jgi:hypothetical protein
MRDRIPPCGQACDALLAVVPRMKALGLALAALPARPSHPILHEARGDEQPHLKNQSRQTILTSGQSGTLVDPEALGLPGVAA